MDPVGRRVLVGCIVGLYGVRGWLKLESWAQPRAKIFDYQPWLLSRGLGEEKNVGLVQWRLQGKGMVCEISGVEDRDTATMLVGLDIRIARELLPSLGAKSYYWADLEGFKVVTLQGVALGTVSHLFATGANDVLVVRDSVRERLIPFVQGAYVHQVDLAGGRIWVDWDPAF